MCSPRRQSGTFCQWQARYTSLRHLSSPRLVTTHAPPDAGAPPVHQYDVLVIGSGAAGLSAALHIAPRARVAVLSKGAADAGSTTWAQGGIAAVTDPGDTLASHIEDTIAAGAGLCHPDIVSMTVTRAPAVIEELVRLGVEFDRDATDPAQSWHLTREGGHSARRVLHVADATGAALSRALLDAAGAARNIDLFEHRVAVDLITTAKLGYADNAVVGAYVLNVDSDRVEVFRAPFVILACGGASKVYVYTSNPDGATGDGIAMGWRAGCRVANMEFNQFHPTCLYHPEAKSFLISEALRGEGARLLLPDGTRFMARFDPREELAPRDIVARAIDHEMKRLGLECVYLDISHRSPAFIESHFPTIRKRCLELGIDMTREPIPVVPAAHYTCGGIVVDAHARTDVPGLYAAGETSFTGLHGANRMASNSLLECLVFGQAAAHDIVARLNSVPELPEPPPWDESRVSDSDEAVVITHNWAELRRFMWDYVGIVRSNKRLQRARHRIDLLKREIHEYYAHFRVSKDLIELRNLAEVADLIIRSASQRKESRGLHFNIDYPRTGEVGYDTILEPAAHLAVDDVMPLPPFPPTDIGSRL